MESVFYEFETLKLNIMTSERIKEIQQETAYPNSVSVQQALLKVWNECEQERVKNCSIPAVINSGKATCPDCGDRGWLYDNDGRRTGTCHCHY